MMSVELAQDIWLWQAADGTWMLSQPLVTDARTGDSMPGATIGKKIVLFKGQRIMVGL